MNLLLVIGCLCIAVPLAYELICLLIPFLSQSGGPR